MDACAIFKKGWILVIVQVTIVGGFDSGWYGVTENGEIIPDGDIFRNISQLPNRTLSLSCSLTEAYLEEVGLNSSSLYWEFERDSGDISEKISGYVINERTLGLELDNASTAMSGVYYCYLNTSSNRILIDSAPVILGDPPQPVTKIQCVSDRFLNMTCNWCPDDTSVMMGWVMEYRINFTRPVYNCTDASNFFNCECTLPDETFFPYSHYRMNVTEYRLDVESSFLQSILTDISIVRPGPVDDLTVEVVNSSSLAVSWIPEKYTKELHEQGKIIYVLTYQEGGEVKEIGVGGETSVTLTSLHPFTEYQIKVRSKTTTSTEEDIYWSDWSTAENITTYPEAPSVGPALPMGALKAYPCQSPLIQCLEVFWQEIDEADKNGPIGGYIVLQTWGPDQIDELSVSDVFSGTLITSPGKAYTVGVQAYTEDRVNSVRHMSPVSTVWVDDSNNWLTSPDLDLETSDVNNTGVMWRWSYTGEADNFTLFMCERVFPDGTKCRTSPVTVSVRGSSRDYYTEGFNPLYVYAIAANLRTQTSGLNKDWVPLCHYNEVPGTPEFSVTASKERSLSVEWSPLVCSSDKPTGLVQNYTVYWTSEQDSNSETVGSNVTEYSIEKLLPYTEYNVTMSAMSRAGSSLTTAPFIITTQESVPEDSPRDVVVSDVLSSSATVSWKPPMYPNGHIHSYHVTAWGGTTNRSTVSESQTAVIENLDGYVNYTIHVVAVNRAGPSTPSDEVYASTRIRAPAEVNGVSVTSQEVNLNVEWEPPVPANGPIGGYMIIVEGNSSQTASGLIRNETVGAEALEHTVVFEDWCQEFSEQQQQVLVRIQAFTVNEQQQSVMGPLSEPQQGQICADIGGLPYWIWIVLTLGIAVAITLVVLLCCYIRKCKMDHDKFFPELELPPEVIIEEKYTVLDYEDKVEQVKDTDSKGTDPDSGVENSSESSPSISSTGTTDSGVDQSQSQCEDINQPLNPVVTVQPHHLYQFDNTTVTKEHRISASSSTSSGSGYAGTEEQFPTFGKPTDRFMKSAPYVGVANSSDSQTATSDLSIRNLLNSSGVNVLNVGKMELAIDRCNLPRTDSNATNTGSVTRHNQKAVSFKEGNIKETSFSTDTEAFSDIGTTEDVDPYSRATSSGANTENGVKLGGSISDTDSYSKVTSRNGEEDDTQISVEVGNTQKDTILSGASSDIDSYSKVGHVYKNIEENGPYVSGTGSDIASYSKVTSKNVEVSDTLSDIFESGASSYINSYSKVGHLHETDEESGPYVSGTVSDIASYSKVTSKNVEVGGTQKNTMPSGISSDIDFYSKVGHPLETDEESVQYVGDKSADVDFYSKVTSENLESGDTQSGEIQSDTSSDLDPYSKVGHIPETDGESVQCASDRSSSVDQNIEITAHGAAGNEHRTVSGSDVSSSQCSFSEGTSDAAMITDSGETFDSAEVVSEDGYAKTKGSFTFCDSGDIDIDIHITGDLDSAPYIMQKEDNDLNAGDQRSAFNELHQLSSDSDYSTA